jgi:plastocyanin
MRINPRLLVIPALVVGLHSARAADITGTITLNGKPPEELVVQPLMDNADCGKLHTEPVKTQFYVVGPKGELRDVIVSIKGLSGKSTGESAEPLVITQKGCEYSPYIAAVQTNQKILVRNADSFFHNVHDTPTAPGNKDKNQPQGPNAPDLTFSFPSAEEFLRFKCEVHPWMFAYVTVVDSPYFAVSAKDGTYKIANVPPGKYTIEAAHRKGGKVSKEIEVKDNAKLDFTIDFPAAK